MYCRASRDQFPDLTVRRSPRAVLTLRVGHDDFSLQVENPPKPPLGSGQQVLKPEISSNSWVVIAGGLQPSRRFRDHPGARSPACWTIDWTFVRSFDRSPRKTIATTRRNPTSLVAFSRNHLKLCGYLPLVLDHPKRRSDPRTEKQAVYDSEQQHSDLLTGEEIEERGS
jgi:hypothetical protein